MWQHDFLSIVYLYGTQDVNNQVLDTVMCQSVHYQWRPKQKTQVQ